MLDELALPYVASLVLEASGNDLASQFLAGVRFMHQENVAHLDLKPDNLLVALTLSPRLQICDYDVPFGLLDRNHGSQGIEERRGGQLQKLQKTQVNRISQSAQTFGLLATYWNISPITNLRTRNSKQLYSGFCTLIP